ncbi:MAG: hypothetical protein HC908_07055 [Calothrix sp. SM1_7_51]|nr:hypothetical protein [Calothrix sp. SM1_7_51]
MNCTAYRQISAYKRLNQLDLAGIWLIMLIISRPDVSLMVASKFIAPVVST